MTILCDTEKNEDENEFNITLLEEHASLNSFELKVKAKFINSAHIKILDIHQCKFVIP